MDLFKNYSYSTGPCTKKLLRNNYTKDVSMNVCDSLTSNHKMTLDKLTCH